MQPDILTPEVQGDTKRGRGRPKKQRPADLDLTLSVPETIATQQLSDLSFTPEDLDELRRLTQRDKYVASFHDFFVDAFPHIEGAVYTPTWHVPMLCQELQDAAMRLVCNEDRHFHLDVNIPPRCLKSMVISVAFPVWFWLHKPNAAILSVSSNVDMAKKMMSFSKNIIRSHWFQRYFPEHAVLEKDDATEIRNSFKGSRRAFGVKTKILGANADLILSDDVLDTDQAQSDIERTAVVDKVSNTIYGRLNDKQVGLIINIQQRLHVEDLSGYLRAQMTDYWRVIKLPSEAKEASEVLPQSWFYHYDNEYNAEGRLVGKLLADLKGRLSRKDLEFEKKRIGSFRYAQQHLQSPRAPEGGMFKTKWFDNQFVTRETFWDLTKGQELQWQLFIDGAQTENRERDPTCILLCCKFNYQLYILQVINVHKRITDLVTFLNNYLIYLQNSGIQVQRALVEDKSIGLDLIDIMRKSAQQVPFIPLSTKNEPKYVRASRATPFVEAGKLWLIRENPNVDPDERQYVPQWTLDFVDQVTGFTNGKGSKHDDAVDTMAYAIANAEVSEVWTG